LAGVNSAPLWSHRYLHDLQRSGGLWNAQPTQLGFDDPEIFSRQSAGLVTKLVVIGLVFTAATKPRLELAEKCELQGSSPERFNSHEVAWSWSPSISHKVGAPPEILTTRLRCVQKRGQCGPSVSTHRADAAYRKISRHAVFCAGTEPCKFSNREFVVPSDWRTVSTIFPLDVRATAGCDDRVDE
jgi:hypothetical protein